MMTSRDESPHRDHDNYPGDGARRAGIWSGASLARDAMNARLRPIVRPFYPLALAGLMVLAAPACGRLGDGLFCDDTTCGFSSEEWSRLEALANLPDPPPNKSNALADDPAAATLGQAFYFDARFSGAATQVDALGRAAAVARAPQGQPANVSCASCHDLGRMGVDVGSIPGNVSSGAGWTDVNALSTVNSAYWHLVFWNGRADSLWALAAAVAESTTTMNGNRLHTAWVISDYYRPHWEMVFHDGGKSLPIPPGTTQCSMRGLVEATGERAGQCILGGNGFCPGGCRSVVGTNGRSACFPMVPLDGKKGAFEGCQPGDPKEPFGDAYDCMDQTLRDAVDHVLFSWAKILEAFQRRLHNQHGTPFDDWINAGPRSTRLDESARRGAQLFVGKASCVDCHNTPLFSDNGFHNVGVAQVGPGVPTLADCHEGNKACDCVAGLKCLPWGQYDGATRLNASTTLRTSKWSDDKLDTSRSAAVVAPRTESMKGAWRTPSLRNVALTAPYMHDGRYATLEEVVDHYDRGGDPDAVGTKDVRIKPLRLTAAERADLVAFMKTLTGPPLPPEVATPPMLPTVSCP
jgi:cytochrome c peroxidase